MAEGVDRRAGYHWIVRFDLRGPAIRAGGAGGGGAPNQCSHGRGLGMLETERTLRKAENCGRLPDHLGSRVNRVGLILFLIKKI